MEVITRYRVTDLVLHSAEDLTTLAAALEARGMRVSQRALRIADEAREHFRIAETDRMWVFQASCEHQGDDPEPELAVMLSAIESLDSHARAAWMRCSQRIFDVAYDCGTKPISVRHDLSAGMLARLAAASGALRITLYAVDPSEVECD